MNKVILLDRDGVLVQDRIDYIQTREQIQVYPRSIKAVDMLKDMGYTIFVITNQSAVAKGIMTDEQVQEINWSINVFYSHQIEKFFYCPHHPNWFNGKDLKEFIRKYPDSYEILKEYEKQAQCDCRKPLPGLIHQAQSYMYFDTYNTFVVGDSLRDINAAKAADCKPVFVKTTLRNIKDVYFSGINALVYNDLLDFVEGEVVS